MSYALVPFYEFEDSHLLANTSSSCLDDCVDQRSGIKVCGRLARREILVRGHVLLKDRGGRHDRPQLFAGVDWIAWRIHVLLKREGFMVNHMA